MHESFALKVEDMAELIAKLIFLPITLFFECTKGCVIAMVGLAMLVLAIAGAISIVCN